MKTYRCDEMMCNGCVSRIKKRLDHEGIGHKVDLETKTVVIEEEKDYGKAVEILDDLGFTAVEQQ
ncbi:heavy-metal-associated domain-containing protein [Hungatella sp. SB206]|uniref:heavy-metal-associated domain-containing protein n=1 Tax=Hungatella sp. SB206 TaxID=2937758 RepID=UPI003DA81384